jgi:nucleotide-binding universal stress UspA family protein
VTIPLVVGIDGSEASLEAVDWAADEAARHEVPLHLVHAAAADHEARDLINAASERARTGASTVRLSSEVLHEDAASAPTARSSWCAAGRNTGTPGSGASSSASRTEREAARQRSSHSARPTCGAAGWWRYTPGVHHWGLLPNLRLRRDTPSKPTGGPRRRCDDAPRGPAERYPNAPVSRRVVEGPARQALLEAASGADLLVVGARRCHGYLGLQSRTVSDRDRSADMT